MTFKKLSEYFRLLEENSSRLKITEILADLFKECREEEIDKICYLSLGRLLPAYHGVEFQMAEKMMEKAIAKAFGVEIVRVMREMRGLGDLGEVGEKIKNKKLKIKNEKLFEEVRDRRDLGELSVSRVYERLMEVAKEAGEGSVKRKIDKMAALLQELDGLSVRFVIRIPLGKMRLGFSEMTILDGLSWMLTGGKSLREKLEDAYNVVADVGEIARKVRGVGGIKGIGGTRPKLGTPILPALAQRLGTVEEMLEKMGKVAVEPKYDGTRLQLHCKKPKIQKASSVEFLRDTKLETDGVRIFTRNLENVTHMFPEIVEALRKEIKAEEVILDSEGMGIDPKTGGFLPFQETIKRKRKHDVEEKAKEIPFKCFIFDILYQDGESLLGLPLIKRRKILEKLLSAKSHVLNLAPQIVTENAEEIRRFHDEQLRKGFEGAMVKKAEASYEAGRRGFSWVKYKQEETKKGGGLADTIDCVVMGTYRGRGKRAGFGVGAFLVGVLRGGKCVTVSKIGTGLTDEQWKEMRVRSGKWEVREKPEEYEVDKNLTPDKWLGPKIVVEIQADNITKSPIHTAGLALRFPRLVKFRDDKSSDQITTKKEVEKLYQLQFGQ